MKTSTCLSSKPAQCGTTLVVSLIMLLLMTLIGTTAIRNTVLEERLSGNLMDQAIAFQAAEAALRDAERLMELAVLPEFTGSGGLLPKGMAKTDPGNKTTWLGHDWANNSRAYSKDLEGVPARPRYVVEEVEYNIPAGKGGVDGNESLEFTTGTGGETKLIMYRITARGTGLSDSSSVFLQVLYRR